MQPVVKEYNVTILSQLFHPYAIIFQHCCVVQDDTWMVSNRSVIVIVIMAQPRALISTVGKKAAGSMEEPIFLKNAPKIKSCKSKFNLLSHKLPSITVMATCLEEIMQHINTGTRNKITFLS